MLKRFWFSYAISKIASQHLFENFADIFIKLFISISQFFIITPSISFKYQRSYLVPYLQESSLDFDYEQQLIQQSIALNYLSTCLRLRYPQECFYKSELQGIKVLLIVYLLQTNHITKPITLSASLRLCARHFFN